MMRWMLIIFLLVLALPVQAAPILHLEASITRTEFYAGDTFTITTHLFNDGDSAIVAGVQITDDGTFKRISVPYDKPPGIAPGTATPFFFSYQVLSSTPHGLHTFTLRVYPTGDVRQIVITVQPVVAPPPHFPGHRLYLPIVRH